jgi:hypothetical protein
MKLGTVLYEHSGVGNLKVVLDWQAIPINKYKNSERF